LLQLLFFSILPGRSAKVLVESGPKDRKEGNNTKREEEERELIHCHYIS
jgi:hypothetical protein